MLLANKDSWADQLSRQIGSFTLLRKLEPNRQADSSLLVGGLSRKKPRNRGVTENRSVTKLKNKEPILPKDQDQPA